jgi:hypothetical protein
MAAKRPERSSGEKEKILQEAKDRFKRASDWEATSDYEWSVECYEEWFNKPPDYD